MIQLGHASILVVATRSVPVCVCVVYHKSKFYRNGWTYRAGFVETSFILSFLHVPRGSLCISKNKVTSLWYFVRWYFATACYQLSSIKVNALQRSTVFTARCYASAVLAMGLCLSVCVCVCHKSEFY